MNRSDVVIIGSGISALTCATLLAKRGKKVVVLEQYSKPGGYLHCYSRFGERYDTGAHYIGAMDPGHPFHTLLNYLGVYDESLFIPLDPTGFDVFHFPEFRLELPKGYVAAEKALIELFPSEASGISKFLALIQDAIKFFPTYQFDDSFIEIPAKEIFETSLADVVNSLTSHPQLRSLLYSYCTLHGVKPSEVAFGFHAIVMDSLIRSPYGLRKGGDELASRFVSRLEELGGEVLLGKQVSALNIKSNQVT